MLDDPANDPRLGAVIDGRYRILARIAEGGMGIVYRAERVTLGRPVAIKFLHGLFAANLQLVRRFENEMQAMSRLSHPHCVSVIDFGVEKAPYLVMDYVTGQTLRELIDAGPLAPGRAVAIVRQVLAGLEHAHQQGIIHRDIKPENIMLADAVGVGDHVRILDFGLAKLRDGAGALTTGLTVGTPRYMSPEQTRAEPVDARTDVYSVGAMLFELLTGKPPFDAEEYLEILRLQREAAPPRLHEAAPSRALSRELDGCIQIALAKAPEARFQSAAELLAALERTPEASGQVVSPPAAPARPGAGTAAAPATSGRVPAAPGARATSGAPAAAPLSVPPEARRTPPAFAAAPAAPSDQQELSDPYGPTKPMKAVSDAVAVSGSGSDGGAVRPSRTGNVTAWDVPARPGARARERDRDSGPIPRRSRTGVFALLALSLLVGGGGTWLYLSTRGRPAGVTPPSAGDAGPAPATARPTEPPPSPPSKAEPAPRRRSRRVTRPKRRTRERTPAHAVTPAPPAQVTPLPPPVQAAPPRQLAPPAPRAPAPEPPPAAEVAHAPPGPSPAAASPEEARDLAEVERLVAAGRRLAAIRLLMRLRRRHPRSARLRYVLGNLYCQRLWWNDCLNAYREAIKRNPAYKRDPQLIGNMVDALVGDRFHYRAARFLVREIGAPARPYLDKAAREARYPDHRKRASRVLKKLSH